MPFKPALLVIDVQNDFLERGSLAVENGDEIVPGIVELLDTRKYHWGAVAYSGDWHPKDHISFASNHADAKPFELVEFTSTKDPDVTSMENVWPDHCIQHTHGANFPQVLIDAYRNLTVPKTIIQKGQLQDRDYYSAFNDIWEDDYTELGPFLKEQGITDVFVVGLAYDFCVKWSSLSSAKLGLNTFVVKPLSKAIRTDEIDKTDGFYRENGVKIIDNLDDEALAAVRK